MAEPAKLQLLTRKPGEAGFQIHEIESSQAYLGYRPQRVYVQLRLVEGTDRPRRGANR